MALPSEREWEEALLLIEQLSFQLSSQAGPDRPRHIQHLMERAADFLVRNGKPCPTFAP